MKTVQTTLINFVTEEKKLVKKIVALKNERNEIPHKERLQLIAINGRIQALEEKFVRLTKLDETCPIDINPLNISRIVESEIKFRFGVI